MAPSSTQTLESGDEQEFLVTSESGSASTYGTVLEVESSEDVLTKQDDFVLVDNRYPNFTPLGYLQVPTRIDLGTIRVGQEIDFTALATNVGQAAATLHGIDARYPSSEMRLSAEFAKGVPVDPGRTETMRFQFSASAPGNYQGQIELNSSAANGIATIDVVARVVAPPETVIITSDPHGIFFSVVKEGVGRSFYRTPAVFTIVDDSPGEGELQRDTEARLGFFSGGTLDGLRYHFQRCEPAGNASVTFPVGENPPVMKAIYAVSPETGPTVADPPVEFALPCSLNVPGDVGQGPWVRVSDARLTLPWLGDAATGTDFQVEGGFHLSTDRATGSLTSSSVRIEAPAGAAHLAGREVFEITPGSWSFDISSSGTARFASLTPGIQLFDRSTQPPSSLALEIDLNATAGSRRAFFRFETHDELPLAPALMAVGPGSVELGLDLNPGAPDLNLTLDGSLHLLAEPGDPDDWLVDLPFNLEFNPALPGFGTATFPSQTQLLEFGILRLHAKPGASISPILNGAIFGFDATDLQVELFRSGTRIDADLAFDSTGDFSISALLPTAGIDAGPFQIEASSSLNRDLLVTGNPIASELEIQLPAVDLNSTANLWDDGEISLPARTFSSETFSVRVPLEINELAGFDLTPQDDTDADNYLEFTRTRRTASVRLRNERDLYFGAYRLGFDLDTRGNLSGTLAGRLGVKTPFPLNQFSAPISLEFDSQSDPEFTTSRYFLNVPMRLKLSSSSPANGGVSILKDNSPDPIETWPEIDSFE